MPRGEQGETIATSSVWVDGEARDHLGQGTCTPWVIRGRGSSIVTAMLALQGIVGALTLGYCIWLVWRERDWRPMVPGVVVLCVFLHTMVQPESLDRPGVGLLRLAALLSAGMQIELVRRFLVLLRVRDARIIKLNLELQECIADSSSELKQSEARYHSLTRVLPMAVFRTDPRGQCIYANARWGEITRSDPRAARGAGWLNFVHPDDRAQLERLWAEKTRSGQPFEREFRLRPKDAKPKETIWVFCQALPEEGADGPRVIAAITDISVRRRMEEELRAKEHTLRMLYDQLRASEQQLHLALESTRDGIWDWDVLTPYCYYNSAWRSILGYDPKDTTALPHWRELLHPDEEREVNAALNDHLLGKTPVFECEHRLRTRDGDWCWVLSRGKLHENDPPTASRRMVGTISDIRARKRGEELLVRAKEAAESANRAKSAFLANVSHEIRTPMTAILGFTDILLREAPTSKTSDRFAEMLQTIQRNGEHLLAIINDILDLSRIEAGRLTLDQSEISLPALVRDVQAPIQVRADAKGLRVTLRGESPIPQTIKSDPTRLRQILLNLLGNAVKFTETGNVTLELRLETPQGAELTPRFPGLIHGARLLFIVHDTGIGISPEQISRLFLPFSQADATTSRRFGGNGLGLAISKRLAEMLGYTLEVQSTEGVGSTFTLAVPLEPIAADRMLFDAHEKLRLDPTESSPVFPSRADPIAMSANYPRSDGSPLNVRPMDGVPTCAITAATPAAGLAAGLAAGAGKTTIRGRILLAEDGRDNQVLIAFFLRSAGADVQIAENGRIAVEQALAAELQGIPFAAILMDMQMPVLDGYSATRELREQGFQRPIIALTANAMAEDRTKCLESGCSDYTSKPIKREALINLVAQWLSRDSGNHPAMSET